MRDRTENLLRGSPGWYVILLTASFVASLFSNIMIVNGLISGLFSPLMGLFFIPSILLLISPIFFEPADLNTWHLKCVVPINKILWNSGWYLLLHSASLIPVIYLIFIPSPLIFLAFTPSILLLAFSFLTGLYPRLGKPIIYSDDSPIAEPPLLAHEVEDDKQNRVDMFSTNELDEKESKERKSEMSRDQAPLPFLNKLDDRDARNRVFSFLERDDLASLSRVSKSAYNAVRNYEETLEHRVRRNREINSILQGYGFEIPDNKHVLNKDTIHKQLKVFARLCRDNYLSRNVSETFRGGAILRELSSLLSDLGFRWDAYGSGDPALFQGELSDEQLRRLDPDNLMLCLNKAAAVGNFRLVRWLIENSEARLTLNTFNLAVCSGNLDMVRWIENRLALSFSEEMSRTFELAIMSGNPMLLAWLLKKYPNMRKGEEKRVSGDGTLHLLAAYTGRSDIAKQVGIYARANLNYLALSGNVEMMNQELNSHSDSSLSFLIPRSSYVAFSGSLPMMQMLSNRFPFFLENIKRNVELVLRNAALSGSLPLVKWLMEQRGSVELSPALMRTLLENAARAGGLDLVKWLVEDKKVNPTLTMLRCAVEEGRLNVVKYLVAEERGEHRIIPDEEILKIAERFRNRIFLRVLEEAAGKNQSKDEEKGRPALAIAEEKEGKGIYHRPSSSHSLATLAVAVSKWRAHTPLHVSAAPEGRGEDSDNEGDNDEASRLLPPGKGCSSSVMEEVD